MVTMAIPESTEIAAYASQINERVLDCQANARTFFTSKLSLGPLVSSVSTVDLEAPSPAVVRSTSVASTASTLTIGSPFFGSTPPPMSLAVTPAAATTEGPDTPNYCAK